MCADAFMFIWTKRQAVLEMLRLIDGPGSPGAVVISHAHNQLVWSPSHGNPLPPKGYGDLFETVEPRLFSEGELFAQVIAGGPLDLSRASTDDALERDPALISVATTEKSVFTRHPLD